MTREGAIGNLIHAIRWNDMPKKEALEMAIEALEQKPSNDTVSCGVFEQAMWERDVAITQLKELGYGLGEKPKTGHWIHRKMDNECWEECSECHVERAYPTLYCPDCGIKMVEKQKGSKE